MTDEKINKMYIHITEYYTKRNKVIIDATTWIDLDNITLSKKIQTQKTTNYMISFVGLVHNRQIHRERK